MKTDRFTHRRGQALVEFALILPVFIILFLGFFGAAVVLFSYVTASSAAREGARFLVANPQATDSQIQTHICATSIGLGGSTANCTSMITSGELVVLVEQALAGRVEKAQVSVTVRYHVPVPTLSVSFLDRTSFTFLGTIWVTGVSVMRIE